MMPMNELIVGHIDAMKSFLDKVSPEQAPACDDEPLQVDLDLELACCFRYMLQNKEKMGELHAASAKAADTDEAVVARQSRVWGDFNVVMDGLDDLHRGRVSGEKFLSDVEKLTQKFDEEQEAKAHKEAGDKLMPVAGRLSSTAKMPRKISMGVAGAGVANGAPGAEFRASRVGSVGNNLQDLQETTTEVLQCAGAALRDATAATDATGRERVCTGAMTTGGACRALVSGFFRCSALTDLFG